MKRLINVFALLIIATISHAQSIDEVNIGVVCPEQINGLSNTALSQLKNKVEQIVASNGISTYMDGSFVIYPVFEIYDKKNIEGGMRKLTIADIGITLFIKQLATGMVANTTSIKLSGSGFSESEAIINAIGSIESSSKQFSDFITTGKSRILKYYEDNCERIIKKSRSLAAQQRYDEALSILAVYPSSLSSYSKISVAIETIYKQYQNVICAKMIHEAKGYIAIRDYNSAIAVLVNIDPESSCKADCVALLNSIKQNVDADEVKRIKMELKVFNANVDLEKRRVEVVRAIAKAYYSNQPIVRYTQIIR